MTYWWFDSNRRRLSLSVSRTILRESNYCDSQDKARNRQGTCAGSEVLYQFYEKEIPYKYCQRQKSKQKRQQTNKLMFSFRFLNRHLVDKYPYQRDDICYLNPDIICKDLPPNRLRFLGTWWVLTNTLHVHVRVRVHINVPIRSIVCVSLTDLTCFDLIFFSLFLLNWIQNFQGIWHRNVIFKNGLVLYLLGYSYYYFFVSLDDKTKNNRRRQQQQAHNPIIESSSTLIII